ncbi:MAG: DEAD/DEAH box helicase, partial [Elusimicrobia bacterium]|nr:DEAD/DEAH box helicase [Elusimicrobiota bacterium]
MLNLWKGSDKLEKLKSLLLRQSNLSVSGLTPNAFISIASSLIAEKNLRTLLIIPRDKTPEEIGEVFSSFSKKPAFSFPADFPSRQIDTLRALSEGRTDTVVTSLEALKSPLPTPDRFNKWHMKVRPGQSAYGKIIKELERGLYFRSDTVFETGEFARRGRVIDYWPPGEDNPIRILFEDDKILSISTFDSSTQRSLKKLDFAALYPAGFEEDDPSSLPHYSGEDIFIVLLDESVDCSSTELPPHSHCLNFSGLEGSDLVFSSHTLEYSSSYSDAKKSMEALSRRGYKFIISAASEIERDKLLELIHDDLGIEAEGFISPIKEGFVSEDLKIAFYTPGDILPYRRTQIRPKAPKAYSVESFSDISPGDYLIHWKFGLGEYLGIEKKQHNDFESDFIKIGYRNNAVIYVAVENSGLIQKYAGKSFNVTLDSLSGRAWNKRKEKVRESVRELAKKLVNLYGARKEKGISFPLNPTLEADFASNFPYPLTPHQSLAIEEVLSDMESSEAMDRLICGDVGFGKTEVLMRAAFRAVINGYQVALLAPTTVLARQHFNVFRDRFSEFPVIIDMLSRLVSPKDRKNVLKNISEGLTDIVVGTHGLLSENVNFPRIGLIIIDEEQRFGVEHKEALRFKYPEADLLTATATPIPRTLAMAMGKVKGFSLINTPPAGRQGVKTMVLPYNKQKIREAIIYEINRGGQIYFVHSRVGTIKETMRRLKELVPEASFDYIHGRMKAERIEKVMEDFINRKFNCLVSTTIIENGLDLPSVNTIIIEEANRLGLADIYQLRGRVG